jgi:class 3 adenylate cyclase/tetratricopeptide (TPR) repeat protein
VNCPGCGREARDDARFCDGCGRTLTQPAAPATVPYTPRHLADKILRSRSALEGERKQVTVLFADVKGSMELAEQVDAESWHGILDRFFGILADGVHRFEGTVNQYTGDGIMALFGAPIAHEDHAQRACHAALYLGEQLRSYAQELRREHGLNFSVRMGLNTGPVVVGKIGDDTRMDYTAQGHTVGLAARMEQLAEPGAVYLSEATADLVRDYFELEDLGDFKVKGSAAPIRAAALRGPGRGTTRLDVARARGFSPFVGRHAELEQLTLALEDARSGNARVVGVCAHAGTGKSRLCHEFTEHCAELGVPVLRGHALSHGRHLPLLPILELLRSFFGVGESDPAQEVREKVAGRLVLLGPELADALPVFFDLLGVPDPEHPLPDADPMLRRAEVFASLRRLLRAAGREGSAVLLIEDLQWIDEASQALLDEIVEAVAGTELMLLLNFRPEYQAPWTDLPHYGQIDLVPLAEAESAELLGELLGDDPGVAALAERIGEQTAGNPFFIEELVRALAEDGPLEGAPGAYHLADDAAELAVPESIQALLAARIDRQPEREKHVLQAAAVIGKRFSRELLERVADLPTPELDAAIANLEEAEFLTREGEDAFAFRHPLTQEVAYDAQLRERRATLHARVAEALQEDAERVDDRAALIAHHLENGGERREAAGWRGRGLAASNPDAARDNWRRVLDLLDEQPEDEESATLLINACTNVLLLSFVSGVSASEAMAVYYRGRGTAEALGWDQALSSLIAVYALITGTSTGDVNAYRRSAEESLALAERTDDPGTLFVANLTLGTALFLGRRLPDACEASTRALELARGFIGGYNQGLALQARAADANVRMHLGQLEVARELLDELVEDARDAGELVVELQSRLYRMQACVDRGEIGRAEDDVLRAAEIAGRVQAPLLLNYAAVMAGLWHMDRGAYPEAIEAYELALAVTEQSRTGVWDQPFFMAWLARCHSALGAPERARALAVGGLERGRQMGAAGEWTLLSLASVLLDAGDPSAADEVAATLHQVGEQLDRSSWLAGRAQWHQERARLALWRDGREAAGDELRAAEEIWTDMGAQGRLEKLRQITGGG